MSVRPPLTGRRTHRLHMPQARQTERDLLGPRKTWGELDAPNWRKGEGGNSHWDTIEAFFDHIYTEFS